MENINTVIAPELQGKTCLDQGEIDRLLIRLDGTEDKSRLGANAILAVGLNASQIKIGAPASGEKNAKYNRLLEIEQELGI